MLVRRKLLLLTALFAPLSSLAADPEPAPPAKPKPLALPAPAKAKPAAPKMAAVTGDPFNASGFGLPSVRIRDLARVESVRSNQLVGYGLVVGLNGTGDSASSPYTIQSVVAMLQRFHVQVDPRVLKTRNVAAVMLTADLPAFAKSGSKLDITVSSVGDAASLQGGTLLQTPLLGADEKAYAVAQGSVLVGGFAAGGGGASATKNHPTAGRVSGGATVEREVPTQLADADGSVRINLGQPDFDNATRIANAINVRLGDGAAVAMDSATVRVTPPAGETDPVKLIAEVGNFTFQPSVPAKIVLNERTGTVVIGGSVRLAPVAVAHGALSVEINTDLIVSQPSAFAKTGETVIAPQVGVKAGEDRASLIELKPGATLAELVRALNALRATPRDIIAIILAIKNAGGLFAEVEVQ